MCTSASYIYPLLLFKRVRTILSSIKTILIILYCVNIDFNHKCILMRSQVFKTLCVSVLFVPPVQNTNGTYNVVKLLTSNFLNEPSKRGLCVRIGVHFAVIGLVAAK